MTATCATHLALAGRSDTLFSDDAATLIHQTSRGYPRAVNNLALQAPPRPGSPPKDSISFYPPSRRRWPRSGPASLTRS